MHSDVLRSRRLSALLLSVCLLSASGCGGGGIGDPCTENGDCDTGFCDPARQVCALPQLPTDSGTPGTDSTAGMDSSGMGTDAGAPFVLVPTIPSILPTWACSAIGAFAPAGTTTVFFETVTGEIFDFDNGMVLRPPGTGVDGTTGIGFEVATQVGPAPDLGVFSFASFTLPPGVTLVTNGGNALGLLACGEAHVEGVIDLRAGALTPGPGGYAGGPGIGRPAGNGTGPDGTGGEAGATNQTPSFDESGGGGGGFGGVGGQGGAITDDPGGGGGTSAGLPGLVPLRGGGGGGGGCGSASGGGGGGAVYLGALGGVWVESSGAGINAGGGGGLGCDDTVYNGGGGGGAGGAILIEGPTVTLGAGATLAANGGGGGGGSSGSPGSNGQSGLLSVTRAAAGASPGTGDGGEGGAAGAENGDPGGFATDGAGGGGGGCGRIRINTASGTAALMGTVSPGASDTDASGTALLTQGVATSM